MHISEIENIKSEKRITNINWAHFQVAFLNIFLGATGVVYMTAYFHTIGFSEPQIGIYGSIIGIASFTSIFGSWFAQKAGSYKKSAKKLTLSSNLFCIAGVSAAYLFCGSHIMPYAVLFLMAFYQFGLYMVTPVILSWYHNVVGNGRWTSFFSTRLLIGDAALLTTYFLVGRFLGAAPNALRFVEIFVLSALFGLFSQFFMNKISDSVVSEKQPTVKAYAGIIAGAFKRPTIRILLIIIIIRSFAYSLIMPFQSVYILDKIGGDYNLLSLLTTIGACASVAAYKLWACMQKRFGNSKCVKFNLILSVADPILWFTASQNHIICIYSAFILFGISGAQGLINAGYIPSVFGMIFDNADEETKSVYTALYYLVNGVSATVAPLLSGFILEGFNVSKNYILLFEVNIDGYRFLFILTALFLAAGAILALSLLTAKNHDEPAELPK